MTRKHTVSFTVSRVESDRSHRNIQFRFQIMVTLFRRKKAASKSVGTDGTGDGASSQTTESNSSGVRPKKSESQRLRGFGKGKQREVANASKRSKTFRVKIPRNVKPGDEFQVLGKRI